MCVARAVPRHEVRSVKAADEAVQKEWDKLQAVPCWDASTVRPWAEVRREADETGETVHIGELCELCFEKGSELPEGHPDTKV